MKYKTILFDADGVLTLPEEVFTIAYAKSHGLDSKPFEQFFRESWPAIVTGNKDLKESIAENYNLWQWQGSVDELLGYWFRAEDVRNEELLALIRDLQKQDVSCCLATDQERYRGEYMKNVMFKGVFSEYFTSSELGVTKTNPQFFKLVIEQLKQANPDLKPSDIVFFDDSQSKVDIACSVGINGQLYRSVDEVKKILLE